MHLSPIQLNDKQKKKLMRLANVIDNPETGIVEEITQLDERVDKVENIALEAHKMASETRKIAKGEDGYTPVKGVDYFDGVDGKDYILTDNDKKDIALEVEVPIFEKIIEKTEIIKEQPIITNQIVKEIKTEFDTTEIDKKIEELEKKLEELKRISTSSRGVVAGGRAGIQVYGSGTKVGTKANEINFGTGLTATNSYGRITVVASNTLSSPITVTGTPNSSNRIFTIASEPTVLVINGVFYRSTGGAITWTYLAGTLTLSQPVGSDVDGVDTNGTIWAY